MTKAEQEWSLIEALEYCKKKRPSNKSCAGCPYAGLGCGIDAAIEKLKEQEPRVMKVGEVCNWVNSDRVTREPVFIEMRSGICAWIIDDEVREIPGAENLTSGLYSKTWRCWTSRPTDEQREATPWE